jgi:hypothetical protein
MFSPWPCERRSLPQGGVRLRFRRIGFAPKDTALVVGATDTIRVRIEMTRLVLELLAVVVQGACILRDFQAAKTGAPCASNCLTSLIRRSQTITACAMAARSDSVPIR